MTLQEKIAILRGQGVHIPAPETLEIGDEVQLEQIQGPNTVLHMGTKLYGDRLMIMAGARLGYEEPVTVENCAVGRNVKLNGGYFSSAVFLDDVVMGKGAHVRDGTLLEEQANGAHTVGLKQTILLPFVTLGSLINFCDVLMAGGTNRRDHSEVGSSFIHFNFTPFGHSGDKATPSLIGDVPRGVMLQSPRIFLGGQAGLVGPLHIDYGTVLAAGFVYRMDHGPDELVVGEKLVSRTLPFNPRRYFRIQAKVQKNLIYIGNVIALWHWYQQVRLGLAGDLEGTLKPLYLRAQQTLEGAIRERINRLGQIAGYMEQSIAELTPLGHQKEIEAQQRFASAWPQMLQELGQYQQPFYLADPDYRQFFQGLELAIAKQPRTYLDLMGLLAPPCVAAGVRWLEQIVHRIGRLFS